MAKSNVKIQKKKKLSIWEYAMQMTGARLLLAMGTGSVVAGIIASSTSLAVQGMLWLLLGSFAMVWVEKRHGKERP